MDELVSIIIPIYNVEKYLKNSIESALQQTYTNLEIILVDDGSPDNCPNICDEYEKLDIRIRVKHQKNSGLSGARNTGIAMAKGKYLFFQDSDDTLEKDCIEKLYASMKKFNTQISVCGRFYEFEDGKKLCKYDEKFEKCYEFEDAIEEMNDFYYFDMSAWGKLYKKELFDDIKFPEGKLSEDYFIMYKLFERSKKISYTSEPLYNYLQRQNSISKNKKINHDFIEAARCQMNDLENNSKKLKIITHVAYASSCLTVADFYIKQGVKCPKEKIVEYRRIIRKNYKFIKKYKKLTIAKKIQFFLFLINYDLYKKCFILYRREKVI